MITRHHCAALLACVAFSSAALLPKISFAQDAQATAAEADGGATTLNKIVVKGARRTTTAPVGSIADTPLATEIDEKTIEEKQVTDLDDLGRSVDPGINSSRADAGINLRGLSGPRIVTVIDGIPIPYLSNSARQGAFATITANGGGDTFDFSSLSALDVVRGADSSRGGSGMLGGAIVLRTLEPEDLIGEGRDWGGIVKSVYDSEDESLSGSIAGAKKFGNTSVLFQGGYRKGHERDNRGTVDSYGNTRTEPNPADFDQSNLLFKVRQQLEGGHRIGLTAENFRRDADFDQRTEQGAPRAYAIGNYNSFEDRSRKRVSLDYDYEALSSDEAFRVARATLYWQELERSSGSNGRTLANVPYGRDNSISNKTFGFSGSATKEFEYGGFDHSVTVGMDAARSKWNQYTWALCTTTCPSLNNQSEIPNVTSTTVGATIEDRISMGKSAFALTPGVRFDWFDYDASAGGGFQNNSGAVLFGEPKDRDGARISPKLLATYDVTPEVELFAQWSMAYRAPTVDELYARFYNPGGRYAQLGNPNLKPETGNGIEIGTNFDTGGLTGRVAAFHNTYDNFIDTVTTTNPSTGIMEFNYTNVSRVRISGIEASAVKTFDNGFNIHGSLAYAYGKNEDTNQRQRSVAPFKAIIGAGYSQDTFGVDLSMTASSAMPDDRVATTFDAPGYGIVDFTGWWTPEEVSGLRVQAGVYNIFDKKYFNALGVRDVNLASAVSQPRDFYSEPGRTFKISLTQRF